MQLVAERLHFLYGKVHGGCQFRAGALGRALLQEMCYGGADAHASQGIGANRYPPLFLDGDAHSPCQAVVAWRGRMIDWHYRLAFPTSLTRVPGDTTSYWLPNCWMTCLMLVGVIDHAMM